MKKLFTMIFALCISLGAWAQAVVSTEGSTTVITSTSTDVWIPYQTAWQTLVENTKFKGDFSSFNWEDLAGKSYTRSLTDARFDFSEATGVQVSSINTLLTYNSLNSNISKLVLPANVSIPTDISSLGVSDAIFKYVFVTNSSGVSSVYVTSKVTDASMLSYEFTASRIESISNNGINLTGDPDAMQVIHDFLVANNVPEEKITIPFVFRGNLDVTGGSVAQNISDAKAAHPEITDDAITSITVTSGTLSSDDLTRLGQLTNLETIILPNGTASFPDLSSLTNFKKVVYKDAKGNYNVLIPKRGSSLDVSVIGDYDVTGTNVTITGELNATDLASINGIANASMINLSGITIASGSSITSLVANGNAAIVLPSSITKAELGTLQNVGGDNPTYKCLAYPDATDANKLHLYAIQSSTIEHLYPLVNTTSTLYFEPWYNNDGTFNAYMLDNNVEAKNIPTYVGKLPFADVDFSMVSVWLSTDFSVLNSNTRFITIPINGTDYDFTAEGVPYNNDGESYKYSNNIDVVSTFKTPGDTMHGRSCKYKGKTFEATENTNITYVRHAGTLGAASAYVNENMMSATRQIFVGNLNSSDVSAMGMMRATTFDFIDATISAENMKAFHNGYVLYLALPDNEESAIEATSADVCNYRDVNNSSSSKCPALLCVGAYNTTTNTLTTWSSAPGNVYKVTSLIRPQVATQIVNGQEVQVRGTGLICATLNNVIMSGQLNWDDISANNGNGKNNGLESASIKTADLTNAYFPDNSHMVFSTASWSNIEHLYLPTDERMNTIPDESMYQFQSLVELCIPYNYEHIGVNAFYNSHIPTITTTDANGNLYVGGTKVKSIVNGIYYDKDGIVIPNNGVNTYTLSENLKSISTGAFNTLHGDLTDVYVLATTAPTCEADAFTKGMYDGWGGFKGNDDHPLSRATYNNNGVLFTMLHFPANVTLAQAKNYTDITRDYTLWDETGAYDGQGNLRVWPNMTEFYRAFRQAIHGVTWNANGWNTTRSAGGNVNDIQNLPSSYTAYVMDEQGQFVLDGEGNKTTAVYEPTNLYSANVNFTAANVIPATTTEAGEGNTYDTQYMGWHQFVLADYYRYKEVEKDANATYVDGQWYTICIPYDLTEEEVINLMGAPKNATYSGVGCAIASGNNAGCHLPTVYSLKKVTREYPDITLGFSQELMNQIANKNKDLVFNNSDGTIDLADYNYSNSNKSGKILIKGGYPYLIRPIFPATVKDESGNVVNFDEANEVKGNLGKYILSVSSFTDDDLGNKYEDEVAIPIISQKLIATAADGETQITTKEAVKDENDNVLVAANQPYYYFFQGTYTKQTMPKAYFIYNGLWYRNTKENRVWDSFTAIIGGKTTENGASIMDSSEGSTGAANFSTYYVSFKSYSDKFTKSNENGVKFNITFEDEDGFDEVVAIDQINGESFNSNVNGPVYNMAGQRVGTSLEGLSKGLYIVNGKKVVVK